MVQVVLTRILISLIVIFIAGVSYAGFDDCVVDTDCYFQYVPAKTALDSRDATLTLSSTDDLDVFWFYSDDTAFTTVDESNQDDSCPPDASNTFCLTHFGNGAYQIGVDATIITEAEKQFCIDVRDIQGTRTVSDALLCKFIFTQDRVNDNEALGASGKTTDDIKDRIDRMTR